MEIKSFTSKIVKNRKKNKILFTFSFPLVFFLYIFFTLLLSYRITNKLDKKK